MSLSQHYSKITKRVSMPPSQVKSGMIVSCEYKNRHGQNKKYLVICINSNYKGEFHCYKLNNFSSSDIIMLSATNGLTRTRGIDHINVSNPQSFYSTLRPTGKRDFKRFNPSQMKGTQVCQYNYEMTK